MTLVVCLLAAGTLAVLYYLAPSLIVYWKIKTARKRDESIDIEFIKLEDGEEQALESYLDEYDGWAGHTYVKRVGDSYFAGVSKSSPDRKSPRWGDSLYVDGRRVLPKTAVEVDAYHLLSQRIRYPGTNEPTIRFYRVAHLN